MEATLISGSPRENGNTLKVLHEIQRGLYDKGFNARLYVLSELDIKYCKGDKSCYQSGLCVHDDDVCEIVKEIFDSQLVIIASPSYWGDVTAQMKTFIDRCTPYCNDNPARKKATASPKGIAVAVRAGNNRKENENLVHTIGHFLGHLDIPLISSFTVEGIDTAGDLEKRPEVLQEAYTFGYNLTI